MAVITCNERDDGRIEVAVDGYVIWIGRDLATAQAVIRGRASRSEDAATTRRYEANQALPRAIETMRRGR